MNDNTSFTIAKARKSDEFYTLYEDIMKEMEWQFSQDPDVFRGKTVLCPCDDFRRSQFVNYFRDNFDRFGLRRLIATGYARGGGQYALDDFLSDDVVSKHGSFFDMSSSGVKSGELKGDGDFRSKEITSYRDMSDMIVTNPPFSLFREFFAWCSPKDYMILGNMNAITYKDVFRDIMEGRCWFGHTIHSGDRGFTVPEDYVSEDSVVRVKGVRWFMNTGNRTYPPFQRLDTMSNNLTKPRLADRFQRMYGSAEYRHYDNFDAIEIPFSEYIPSDYDGVMGVPISFLDNLNPTQFRIIGNTTRTGFPELRTRIYTESDSPLFADLNACAVVKVGERYVRNYVRLLIKRL